MIIEDFSNNVEVIEKNSEASGMSSEISPMTAITENISPIGLLALLTLVIFLAQKDNESNSGKNSNLVKDLQQHSNTLDDLNNQHQQALTNLKAQHQQALTNATNELKNHIEATNELKNHIEAKLINLEYQHYAESEEMKETYKKEVQTLKDQLKSLKLAVKNGVKNGQLETKDMQALLSKIEEDQLETKETKDIKDMQDLQDLISEEGDTLLNSNRIKL
jgi:hypothetical protein